MKLIFCIQMSMKVCYKLMLWFWCRWTNIPKVPKIENLQCLYNISKKEVRDVVVDFVHVDKHQSFLQGDSIISDEHDQSFWKYSK